MRWLSRLSVVLILCLVTVGLTAAPVQAAAPSITVSPSSGVPGDEVSVHGHNFTANEWVDVYYDANPIDEIQTDDDGDFPAVTFTIPQGYAGVHNVSARENGGTNVSATFTVKPGLAVYPEEDPVGTNVTVRGLGFDKNEANIEVRYYLDGNYTAVVSNSSANATGSWQRTFRIPPGDQGSHKIDATGNSSSPASVRDAYFEMKPGIGLDRTSGSLGQNITMTGSGFAAGERDITIYVSGQPVRTGIRADNTGYWRENFAVQLMHRAAVTHGLARRESDVDGQRLI